MNKGDGKGGDDRRLKGISLRFRRWGSFKASCVSTNSL
jgi:hypothetical protein